MLSLKERIALKKSQSEPATPVLEVPVVENKILSFAEKLALQRAAKSLEPKVSISPIFAMEEILDAKVAEEEKIGAVHPLIERASDITVADITPRIRALNSLSEADLENEMSYLKLALLANPEAVNHMLPEDIGELVAATRKLLGIAIIDETKKVKAPKKEKSIAVLGRVLTKEDLLAMDDF